MSVLCLCDVGTRDVRWQGSLLDSPRSDGRKLWQEAEQHLLRLQETKGRDQHAIAAYERFRDNISLPIIGPALKYILSRHDTVDKLVLYVTDQDRDRAGDTHWSRDTIEFGHLIAWWIPRQAEFKNKIRQIDVRPLTGVNPSLYDEAFAAFGTELRSMRTDEVANCYLVVVGGTAAFNMALLFHGSELLRDRCHALYLPEGQEEPFCLDIGQRLQRAILRRVVEGHLDQLDFAAALPLMEAQRYHPALCALVRYAKHRLHFDFDEAQSCLEEAMTVSADEVPIRVFVERMGKPLQGLRAKELGALLAELYHNAMTCYHVERYASFLARVFLLEEAVARYMLEHAYGIGTDDAKDRQAFKEFVENHAYLLPFMEEQMHPHSRQPLKWDQINVDVLMALLRYVAEDGRARDGTAMLSSEGVARYRAAYELLERLDSLRDLRNKCIIAHGFEGVSGEKIRREYGDGDPSSDMARLMVLLGFSVETDPFSQLAEFVKEQLRLAP